MIIKKRTSMFLIVFLLSLILVGIVLAAPLPTVNGDSGTWGTILNTFLEVSLASDGTLKSNVVGTAQITDGVIANADVSTSAAIALSKLASGTDGQIIVANGDGVPTYVTMGTDATISNTGALTIAANSVALGTDTTNNYVATLADSGAGIFTIANSGAESAAVTIAMAADKIDGTQLTDTITMDAIQIFASPSAVAPDPDYNFVLDGTGTGADYDSPHLIFRGNDGAANTQLDIRMFLDVTTTSDYKIAFYDDGALTEVGSIDESGNLQMDGIISAPTITLTGTGTLNGLDSIDATGETTLEAALDLGDTSGDFTGTLTTATLKDDIVDGTELKDSITMDATQTFASPSATAPAPDYNFVLDGTGTGADYDSPHLILRGNDGVANTELDISMFLDVTTTSDYKIAFYDDGAVTEVGSIDESGNLQMDGIISAPTITLTGTGTLNALDSIDATSETTLEAALDLSDTSGDFTGALTTATLKDDIVDGSELKDSIALDAATTITGTSAGVGLTITSNINDAALTVSNANNGGTALTLTSSGGGTLLSAAGACFDGNLATCILNDYAELYPASESVEQGSLVSIDDSKEELYVKTTRKSYDTSVIGIVSTSPAMVLEGSAVKLMGGIYTHNPLKPAIAMAGRVTVKVTNENGPIKPGDLLVPSSTPGYAMRCPGRVECIGSIVGKALMPFKEREGKVLALVIAG